jgi:phospholipase/carboxylesterase
MRKLGKLDAHVVEVAKSGRTVWLMHGFGAPGDDLVPLADELALPGIARYVFPEAPLSLGFGDSRAWWLIDMLALQQAMMHGRLRDLSITEPDGLTEARAMVEEALAALSTQLGVRDEDLVLGGFSQGAMLACDLVLRSDKPYSAMVLLSGTYLARTIWTPLMPKRAGMRVFQSHGRQDPLLPFSLATDLRDALRAAGCDVTWVEFDGGHGIAPNVMGKLAEFLSV